MNRDIAWSKESLDTLQQSESMLRQLYDALPVMVGVIASLADNILYLAVNEPSAQFMGMTAQSMRGRLGTELGVPPRHIRSWLEHLRESKRLRRPVQFEYAHKKPDGIEWLAVTVNHIGTGSDSLPRFTYLAQIITQRKWMEEEFATRFWQLQSFYNISQTVLNSTNLKSTLDTILAETLARGAYDTGAIYLVRPAIHGIETVAWKGYRNPENLQPNPNRAVGHSIKSEKIRVLEDVSESDGYSRLNREGVRAAVSLPICAGSEVLGIFEVGRRIASKLQLDDIRLLENINYLIGIALQKHVFHENSERHQNQVQVLFEIEKAMTSTLNLESVLDNLLAKIDSLLPYSATALNLWDPTLRELTPATCHNLDREEWLRTWAKRKKGLSWTVFQSQTPLVIKNLQNDPRTTNPAFARKHGLVSYLGVPLQAHGETLGVLSFYTKTDHNFTPEEVQILCTLGGQAAMAIQNSRLYEEAKHSSQELSALFNVTAAASQSLDLDTVLQEVIQKITEIFHFVTTRIFLFDAKREELHLRASLEPCPEQAPRHTALPRGQGIVGRVAQIGRPVVFDDLASDPTYRAWSMHQTAMKAGLHFVAAFPIKTKDQVLGVLICTGKESRTLSLQETHLLTSMANQIAVAVENMQLFAQTKTQTAEIAESREQLRRFAAHLQSVREQERIQVAREIHDELGQLLTGLKMDLAWLRKKLPQKKSLLIDKTNSMSQLLDQSIQRVRKISAQLRPSVLDSLGLTAAIEWQLREFRTRNGNHCNVQSHLEEVQLDPQRSTALFRIFQEGLTNITRHAKANYVEVSLRKEGRYVVLEVTDNGIGIDPGMILDPKSLGLLGMRERAFLLGGQVVVGRAPQQGGTSVTARLPIDAPV